MRSSLHRFSVSSRATTRTTRFAPALLLLFSGGAAIVTAFAGCGANPATDPSGGVAGSGSSSGSSSGSGSGSMSSSGSGSGSGSGGASSGGSGAGSSSGSIILTDSGITGDASTGPIGVRSAAGFFHPGVVVTQGGLNFVRNQLVAGNADLTAALAALKQDLDDTTLPTCPSEDSAGRCHLPATPSPPASHATVTCGSHSAAPPGDTSCDDEKSNALAAYSHALLWYLTGDESHAQTAIQFLDAWNNVTMHVGYMGSDNSPLQCGWTGTLWARAAELIRYTYPQSQYQNGWSDAQASAFGNMLTTGIRPYVATLATQNGNWELSQADAFLQISVYNDQMADYQQAAQMWRTTLKDYVYLTSDGTTPTAGNDVIACTKNGKPTSGCGVDYWWGLATATGLVDGTSQETCRDLEHVQYGIGAAVNAAETAAVQKISGIDLYGDTMVQGGQRLYTAMEFHALLLKGRSNFDTSGDGGNPDMGLVPAPSLSYTCDGTNNYTMKATGSSPALIAPVDFGATRKSDYPVQPMWDQGYNYFVNVLGKPMPNTEALLAATSSFKGNRPTLASHPLAWETLTKLGVGATGFPK
jgi:hypothetical protein